MTHHLCHLLRSYALLISLCLLLEPQLVLSAFLTTLSPTSCPSGYFNCGANDICLAPFFVCDGDYDCEDGRDESNCHGGDPDHLKKIQCLEDQFRCNGSRFCFPNRWRCDGHRDCIQGDDELNCGNKLSSCGGFVCKFDGACVSGDWRCDGKKDCIDGSDEVNCTNIQLEQHHVFQESRLCFAEQGRFECTSGLCLNHDQVCNKKGDCPAKDDEGPHCDDALEACKRANCSHECMPTPQGARCFCPKGYQMNSDRRTCRDVDECDAGLTFELSGCTQNCSNLPGSYLCHCLPGYELSSQDNRTCLAATTEPLLLFTDGRSVRGMWLRTKRYIEVASENRPRRGQSMGVDINMESQQVFWTEVESDFPGVYTTTLGKIAAKPLVTFGFQTPEAVVYDWVGENLYITDAGTHKIVVCTVNGKYCATLLRSLDNPRSLALNPYNGSLWWSDWGDRPGIYATNMDGSARWSVVTRNIVWPNGLAFDETLHRIYWADAKLERIEYLELTTGDRHVLLDENEFHPYSLDVFENRLFWSDWMHFTLDSVSKFSGSHNFSTLIKERSHIFGVRVAHPVRQSLSRRVCWASICSHLCLVGPSGNESVCACPDHMVLGSDGYTCEEKSLPTILLYASRQSVYQLNPHALGYSAQALLEPEQMLSNMTSFDDYAYDAVGKELFLYQHLHGLLYNYKVQHMEWTLLPGPNHSSIHQLTFDAYSANLYWLDLIANELVMSSTNGLHRRVLISFEEDRPTSFTLFQERDELFVASINTNDHQNNVWQTDLIGRNKTLLLQNVGGQVNSMTVCRHSERLYWSDETRGQIRSVSLFNHSDIQIVAEDINNIRSIAVEDGHVYWTELESDFLFFGEDRFEDTMSGSVKMIGVDGTPFTKRLHMLPTQHVPNLCLKNANNCSHLCAFAGFHPSATHPNISLPAVRCLCPDKMKLNPITKVCEPISVCSGGKFYCKSSGKCIASSKVCDGHFDCSEKEDEVGCLRSEVCEHDHFNCGPTSVRHRCIPNAWLCDGHDDCDNGEDERTCHDSKKLEDLIVQQLPATMSGNCTEASFLCDKRLCLPWNRVCDGKLDCQDGTDENKDCMVDCPCKHNGKCFLRNGTWACHCPPGFFGNHCQDEVVTHHQAISLSSRQQQQDNNKITPMLTERNVPASGWMITLVTLVFVACLALLAGLVYYLETEGRLSRIGRRLQHDVSISFRSPMSKPSYYKSDAAMDLLSNLER